MRWGICRCYRWGVSWRICWSMCRCRRWRCALGYPLSIDTPSALLMMDSLKTLFFESHLACCEEHLVAVNLGFRHVSTHPREKKPPRCVLPIFFCAPPRRSPCVLQPSLYPRSPRVLSGVLQPSLCKCSKRSLGLLTMALGRKERTSCLVSTRASPKDCFRASSGERRLM